MKLKKQERLIGGLAVLAVAVLTPILCINLLAPAVAQEDGGAIEEQESESRAPMEMIGISLFCPTDEQRRDPEFALQNGILGYVELTWMDVLPPSAMRLGDTWTGKWLAHFVSHTCEVTEVELHIEPGEGSLTGGRYYTREDGTKGYLDFSSFLSYWPQGVFNIEADETMVIEVTLGVSADLPRSIQDFRLYPYDIWTGEHQGKMPLVALLYPRGEVQIIHDPLPLDDP